MPRSDFRLDEQISDFRFNSQRDMALQQHVMSWFMHTLNEMPTVKQDYDHWLQDGRVLIRSKNGRWTLKLIVIAAVGTPLHETHFQSRLTTELNSEYSRFLSLQ